MTRDHAAQAYLDQPATDRLETRLPTLLKQHAEAVAKARGETLSEYVVALLAERVANEIVATQEWRLTPTEQAELLRVLATPAPTTPALQAATRRAVELFGT
jgi:uncharacterized protein (DUF1778 family)